MEHTKEDDWQDAFGGFFVQSENLEAKMNLLAYVPKDVALLIMKKLPPNDILSLCSVKNKRVNKLCKDFMLNKDYQRIWNDSIVIKAAKIANQPLDVRKVSMMKLSPIILAKMCSINKKLRDVCRDKKFRKDYFKHWSEELEYIHESGIDPESMHNLLTFFPSLIEEGVEEEYLIQNGVYEPNLNNVLKYIKLRPDVGLPYLVEMIFDKLNWYEDMDEYEQEKKINKIFVNILPYMTTEDLKDIIEKYPNNDAQINMVKKELKKRK